MSCDCTDYFDRYLGKFSIKPDDPGMPFQAIVVWDGEKELLRVAAEQELENRDSVIGRRARLYRLTFIRLIRTKPSLAPEAADFGDIHTVRHLSIPFRVLRGVLDTYWADCYPTRSLPAAFFQLLFTKEFA